VCLQRDALLLQLKNSFVMAQLNYLDNKVLRMQEKLIQLEAKPWGNMEKETLKKYLLNFGFGRWSTIKKKSA
jgi:ectoine hydroxylase-related dioxygenase (phytanoyl-CoA dioxygenase family)